MAFLPMYVLGFMGATRRLDHYDSSTGWRPFFVLMFLGGVVIMVGIALQVAQILASIIQKRQLRDTTGDPWGGRTLEWSTPSPPAVYNFNVIPTVSSRDAFWKMKQGGLKKSKYEDIIMPKNMGEGIYISAFAFLAGFAFVWEIVWLAVVSIIGIVVVLIMRTFNEDTEYVLPAATVRTREQALLKQNSTKTSKDDEDDMSIWQLVKFCFDFASKRVLKIRRGRA
jgi:cytochrome o ubiquinol oxidase subunit 1